MNGTRLNSIKEASQDDLGLNGVPCPFPGRYLTKSEAPGYDGVWIIHEVEPVFRGSEWVSEGCQYELGIDDSPGLEWTPDVARGLAPEDAVFRITDWKG